jgi:hypothetical protein
MGTSIELTVGGVALSYSKNHMGIDYGHLFQEGDETRRELDGINYDYYEKNPEAASDLEEQEEVFARPLGRMLPRLELLGFTLDAARSEYDAVVEEAVELASYSDRKESKSSFLTFDEFCALACRHSLCHLNSSYIDHDTPEKIRLSQGRFVDDLENFKRLPQADNSDFYWSETSFLAAKLCLLSAESMLRVFALNRANIDVDVIWNFGPLVHAGWAARGCFIPNSRRTQRILVATEGASDASIIKRSLQIFRPDVVDFLHFVNGDERHHFWGTGNLVKFAEGLLRIDIQNKVLFLLDNDAEGVDAHRRLQELKISHNMRSMLLPDLDELKSFPARGPEGLSACDINGRAAAIECFLDLNLPEYPPAQVIWSNYKKDVDAWHGVLEHKESYQRHFFKQTDEEIRLGPYDASKLLKLLDALIAEAANLA